MLQRYYDGASPDDMWAVPSLGIDPATGREVFLKKNGEQTFVYSADDEVVVGCSRPDVEGIVGTSFYYKGFSASLNFRYRIGGQVMASALDDKVENISSDMVFRNQDLANKFALMQNKQAANQPKWKRREKSSLQ